MARDAQDAGPTEARPNNRRRWLVWGGVALAAVAVTIGGYFFWLNALHHPSTDDAYVTAQVVHVAPQVSGRLAQLPVHDQEHVAKGALLFKIDPAPFEAKVDEAEAQLAVTRQTVESEQSAVDAAVATLADRRAAFEQAEKQFRRERDLVRRGSAAQADLDNARAMRDQAQADVHVAEAELRKARQVLGSVGPGNDQIRAAKAAFTSAQLDLEHTDVHADCAGRITGAEMLHAGNFVTAGQPAFSLVCDGPRWVYANYQETNLERIRPGQIASISIDMYPDRTFQGIVEAIAPASGAAFSLLPPENATGNWVKVTQRVPVRILIVDAGRDHPLSVQTSAEVSIDTGEASEPDGLTRRATLTDAEAMARARKLGLVPNAGAAAK